jgi:hypothetical protein
MANTITEISNLYGLANYSKMNRKDNINPLKHEA